jgi:hypothetical protein
VADTYLPSPETLQSITLPPAGAGFAGVPVVPAHAQADGQIACPWIPISTSELRAWANMGAADTATFVFVSIDLSHDGQSVTTSVNTHVPPGGAGSAVISAASEAYAYARLRVFCSGPTPVNNIAATLLSVPKIVGEFTEGGGSITLVESTDGSVTVENGAGPTVNLSVPATNDSVASALYLSTTQN